MSNTFQESATKRPSSRSRPTTPLRPSSRGSFRDSARGASESNVSFPLNRFEPAFGELSDAIADLEANMMHFQLMHESLARFSENFASFLYGLNMNAFCVDFPEAPPAEAFKRQRRRDSNVMVPTAKPDDIEATFMTTDTTFVENPATTTKSSSSAIPERQSRVPAARGTSSRGRPSGTRAGRGRGSGLPRGRGR